MKGRMAARMMTHEFWTTKRVTLWFSTTQEAATKESVICAARMPYT